MTTISLNDKIESQDLNRAFGRANKFYRMANLADQGYFNIRMSFQGIVLDQTSDNFQTDEDAYQKFYRAPDDIEIMSAIVDLWGVNRMGYNTNNNVQPDTAIGTNFNIRVLGNFTTLDEETGYPQTYKSSEFNIVSDIDVAFDDRVCLSGVSIGSSNPVVPLSSYPNYLLCQSGLEYPGITRKSLGGADRDMYYPVEESRPLVSLLRGAQYIFDISHTNKDKDGAPYEGKLTGLQMDSIQDVTSADIVLVCRTTRRRYS